MSDRSVPYHCPYCGGENLRPYVNQGRHEGPHEGPHVRPHEGSRVAPAGAWECRECVRVFAVTLIGLVMTR
jgi:hypothetical protein